MGGVQEVKKERVEGGRTYTAMQNIYNQIEGLMGGSQEKGFGF